MHIHIVPFHMLDHEGTCCSPLPPQPASRLAHGCQLVYCTLACVRVGVPSYDCLRDDGALFKTAWPCLQNSTLVLTSDNKNRGNREPTGEPVTLANRSLPKMGDRAERTRPAGADDKAAGAKKKYGPCAQQGYLLCTGLDLMDCILSTALQCCLLDLVLMSPHRHACSS